jgi:rRNA-processing protein EBP2
LTTEDDFDVELDAAAEKGGKRQKMTRDKRNERYGFGGSKRNMKRNDADVGDMSSFDRRGGRGGFSGRGRGGAKRGGRPQRPGKQRRMQKR